MLDCRFCRQQTASLCECSEPSYYFSICCKFCGAIGPSADTAEQAEAYWLMGIDKLPDYNPLETGPMLLMRDSNGSEWRITAEHLISGDRHFDPSAVLIGIENLAAFPIVMRHKLLGHWASCVQLALERALDDNLQVNAEQIREVVTAAKTLLLALETGALKIVAVDIERMPRAKSQKSPERPN